MSEEKKFTHIAVTADDDDDFVIEAGVRGSRLSAPPVADGGEGEATASAEQPRPTTDGSARRAHARTEQAQPSKGDRGAYRETTLEDLESSKMPAAQKAVIVLAVIGIAAFIVWYLMR